MASLREPRRQRRERAPLRRDAVSVHNGRQLRNRCGRAWRAFAESLHREWRRRGRALLLPAPAKAGATGRDVWPATTAPASPPKRSARRAASYTDPSTLLETELGGVDLSATLEVHPDSTAPICRENAIHRFGVGDRSAIHLHDHISRLKADLLLHAVTNAIHQRALATLDLVLGTNGGCERDELDLPEDRHAGSIDVRQIGDGDTDGNLLTAAPHDDRVTLSDAQLQELGVPIVGIVQRTVLRADDDIARTNPGAIGRRAGHDRTDDDSGPGSGRGGAAR